MKKCILSLLSLVVFNCQTEKKKDEFIWGVSSAAYQVEGAWRADGKGSSVWDYLTNEREITKPFIGELQTGNTSINMYDREQYLQDIKLLKKLGVNTYRFSISWPRIIPYGKGEINEKGIAHYAQLIDDLKSNGIEPFITMYHFDLPKALADEGGWSNPESVTWFKNYAAVIFENFGKKVNHFITFNEIFMEHFFIDMMTDSIVPGESIHARYAKQFPKLHHQLLASAAAIKLYRDMQLSGKIGITFNMSPCLPAHPENPNDVLAAKVEDKLLNRFVLDPLYKGAYPKEALDSLSKYNPSFSPNDSALNFITSHKPDFLGINFYAPALVQYNPASAMRCDSGYNPDLVKSANGSVRPDQLYALLIRLKNEYGNPLIYITENGSSFGEEDTVLADGSIRDLHRVSYIQRHVTAALRAKHEGVNLKGYFVWSGWDNFEWIFGYTRRFGIIHVDFANQKRIPKQSFFAYQKIIMNNKNP